MSIVLYCDCDRYNNASPKKIFSLIGGGPFLVGAPVRPHMSPMSKSGTDHNSILSSSLQNI